MVAPAAFGAPASVSASEFTGSISIDVDFGYDGSYAALAAGLVAPARFQGFVIDDPLNLYTIYADDNAVPDHIQRYRITVAPGTRYLRVVTASTDAGSHDDLDLYVLCPDGACPNGSEVLASNGSTPPTKSSTSLTRRRASTSSTCTGSTPMRRPAGQAPISRWASGRGPISTGRGPSRSNPHHRLPASAPAVKSLSVGRTCSPGEFYLGLVTHSNGNDVLGQTLVEVVTPTP